MSKTFEERFNKKIIKDISGCWLWIGSRLITGYGQLGPNKTGERYAHRVSYVMANGPIPDGKTINHKCDERSCVNPNHLYLGTHKENNRDTYARTGSKRAKSPHFDGVQIKYIRGLRNQLGLPLKKLADLFSVRVKDIKQVI